MLERISQPTRSAMALPFRPVDIDAQARLYKLEQQGAEDGARDHPRTGATLAAQSEQTIKGAIEAERDRCLFLNAVERDVPAGKLIEAVVDNYATHKHPKVKEWLARHPRWTFHFTPTSGSWLNAVENFFSVLTRKRIRRGSFHSVVDLQAAINRYLAEHNTEPKPFVWKASAASILAKPDRLPAASE
jgi:transposase